MPPDSITATSKNVYLPLIELDKCAVCLKTGSEPLRLCSSCGEKIYCSPACQKKDWAKHKVECGKTDRIDLTSFYPFIASLIETARQRPDRPTHPALRHKIMNSPNPDEPPSFFPGGLAKVVAYGEPIPPSHAGSPMWWPTAASDKVRSKMLRRILRDGDLVPILVSICMALLSEFYTTTWISGEKKRRCRLQYRSTPIADFGIVKGAIEVGPEDKLVYLNLADGSVDKGQDPNEHYLLYFTTIRGEEFTLDCGMFVYNFCITVDTDAYLPQAAQYAPAYFRDRGQVRNALTLHTPERRFSFLRNDSLQRLQTIETGKFSHSTVKTIWSFMEEIAGRGCTVFEKEMVLKCTLDNCLALNKVLTNRTWSTWPKEPLIAIEVDPGQEIRHAGGN